MRMVPSSVAARREWRPAMVVQQWRHNRTPRVRPQPIPVRVAAHADRGMYRPARWVVVVVFRFFNLTLRLRPLPPPPGASCSATDPSRRSLIDFISFFPHILHSSLPDLFSYFRLASFCVFWLPYFWVMISVGKVKESHRLPLLFAGFPSLQGTEWGQGQGQEQRPEPSIVHSLHVNCVS